MSVIIEELKIHSDHRGIVFEPLKVLEFPLQQNAHLVISNMGVVRGNHYHTEGTEIISAYGPTLFRYKVNHMIKDVMIKKGKVFRFTIPAMISHAFKHFETPGILIAFNTEKHCPGTLQTHKDILISMENEVL